MLDLKFTDWGILVWGDVGVLWGVFCGGLDGGVVAHGVTHVLVHVHIFAGQIT